MSVTKPRYRFLASETWTIHISSNNNNTCGLPHVLQSLSQEKMDRDSIIKKYDMTEHPEGGFYKEIFRSDVSVEVIIDGKKVSRPASTAIYFLLTPGNVSRLHRIKSDEVWHHYLGGSITVVEVTSSGVTETVLGKDIENGQLVQYTVKADTWFGSYLNEGSDFALVGCTVAPGFVFEDFELASRSKLLAESPESAHNAVVKLTEGLP